MEQDLSNLYFYGKLHIVINTNYNAAYISLNNIWRDKAKLADFEDCIKAFQARERESSWHGLGSN